MTRRLLLLAFALNLAVAVTIAWTQETNRIPIVGILALSTGPADPIYADFRQSLRELGYQEGRNIRIEYRWAQGNVDRLQDLARELVQLKADVIIAWNTSAAKAAQRATSTVPIVVAFFDPVAAGLVANLSHPGGNITGLSFMNVELGAKRLQLLKEAMPRLKRVAVLWNPDTSQSENMIEDLKAAAPSMSIDLSFVRVRMPDEFDAALAAVSRANAQALYVVGGPLFYVNRKLLGKLASKARLPTIYGSKRFTAEGGLMSYGASYSDQIRGSAVYVDKILKGIKPGDLPIEQPTKFELVVNLKTAKALGIEIPQSLLLRADEVIR